MNTFKTNSRFSVLAEEHTSIDINKKKEKRVTKPLLDDDETSVKQKVNRFKDDTMTSNFRERDRDRYCDTPEYKERKEKEYQEKLIREAKQKEEATQKALATDNFPTLYNNTSNINTKIDKPQLQQTFITKLKTENLKQPSVKEHIVSDGTVEISIDPVTRKTRFNYGKSTIPVVGQQELAYNVLDSLVELHEKRIAEYIEMWGEDQYDTVFTFPNYDYEYFDKLDELYQQNTYEENSDNDNDEYDDQFNNYWRY
jgi:hypothetical protein